MPRDTRLIERWLPISELGIESVRERTQRLALANREATVAQHLRVGREQLCCRRHVPAESLLEMRDDRAGRGGGELLARDLERERPKRVQRRVVLLPRTGTEVRPRVDQLGEHRIGVAEVLPRRGIGGGGGRYFPSMVVVALGEPGVPLICCA